LLPTAPCLLTWRTSLFAHDGEYPSIVVTGLPTTAPPFASPLTLSHPTVQVTLFTYIDDISNSSRPRLEQYLSTLKAFKGTNRGSTDTMFYIGKYDQGPCEQDVKEKEQIGKSDKWGNVKEEGKKVPVRREPGNGAVN
jgi:hypothetical protein